MNVLSLFDGISCSRLALESIGITPEKYFASEIDTNAIKITMANFNDTMQPIDKKINFQSILKSGYTDRKKSLCIPASYGKGSNLKMYFEKRRGQLVFDNDSQRGHRLLTPNECEKLAGIPQNYTDCVAKTHRYHGIGNGFTIPVIAHILKNMELNH